MTCLCGWLALELDVLLGEILLQLLLSQMTDLVAPTASALGPTQDVGCI